MKINGNLRYLFLALSLLFVFFTFEYFNAADRKQLRKKGRFTICTITNIRHRKKPSEEIPVYSFSVNGQIYEGRGNGVISKTSGIYFNKADIGKRYFLMFLPNDPTTNSILPYNRPTDSLTPPSDGWPSLPIGEIKFPIPE